MMCMLETWSVYFFHSSLSPFDFFFPISFIQVAKKKGEKGRNTHNSYPTRTFFFLSPFF